MRRFFKISSFFVFICFIIVITLSYTNSESATNSCLECHSNSKKMLEMGYPQFTVTKEEVERQTKMPGIECQDCHLGNPKAYSKEEAHKGLLRLYVVKAKGLKTFTRDKLERYTPTSIEPHGNNPVIQLLPLIEKEGKLIKDPEVVTILFHDKDPESLSINFSVIEKTCGKCHPKEVEEFKKTAMGTNAKQSQYKTWIDKNRGPHNCGSWFIDNYEDIAKNTKIPFTKEMAVINQKACNYCHVGCLDCHYNPQRKNSKDPAFGSHTFTKNVSPQTCYGGGRGSICHAGPEDRRRGAGYIGGAYSNPKGAEPDIHFLKGLACINCHESSAKNPKLLHGQIKRQVDCAKCHEAVVKSWKKSIHKNVSCEACHIQNVGGYTGTFWGPGKTGGIETPFYKYKEYYGVMKEPILIKDQNGRWIPVKPYAMGVLNQKSKGDLRPGLAWRFPKSLPDLERTDDAYAFVGLLSGLPSNDNVLAWIQMDKMSHKYGKSRKCESCHTENGEQRQEVFWKYTDKGAEPFEGKHIIIANKEGLFIKDMQATTEIKTKEGRKIEDFAPWHYLKDKWQIKGDFSIPLIKNKTLYMLEKKRYDEVTKIGGIYHK